MTAVLLGILPVLYFSFLYYTDPGSTFFVLLTYWLCIHNVHILAAIAGTVAICFRQTNVVWVAFCAITIVAKHITDFVKQHNNTVHETQPRFVWVVLEHLLYKTALISLVRLCLRILYDSWSYLLVGVMFFLFIIVNGGKK
jgi:alpha-1,2-glucosyltransferase